MWQIEDVNNYFYNETKGYEIVDTELVETKYSYFDQIQCYKISTRQNVNFYAFVGDTTLTNVYPARENESLDEVYFKHVGFIAEYSSNILNSNFIVSFIKDTSVFPILDRRMGEICKDITLDKNASQLCGLANQIRDCYLTLTDYLMNKNRTKNPEFKNDNFKDNLSEFLSVILPGSQSDTRRNVINTVAQKGWKFNSELVHKDSITVFDILISFNILQFVVSAVSNIIVGNNMPFNKIKCPRCKGERHFLQEKGDSSVFLYECEDCGNEFIVSFEDIIKKI